MSEVDKDGRRTDLVILKVELEISPGLLEGIDETVRDRFFETREEFIISALREAVQRWREAKSK